VTLSVGTPSVVTMIQSRSSDRAEGAVPAVRARGLVKRYKDVVALDGVDLTVPTGTVLGLLGPNGAGKTTAVRILTTLLKPDAGEAAIAGIDVLQHPREVRRHIGLSGQYAAVDEYLTGYENLEMIGRLYHLGKQRARERARELLAAFRLEEAADRPSRTYSGGMRRRLDLAGALVADPPVIFLDEPTTGLDPRGRNEMWEVISSLVAGGTTLLLTTQYLEEADALADEIVVIDRGRVIAQGTADELKLQVGGERLEVTVHDATHVESARGLLEPLGVGHASVDGSRRSLVMPVTGGAQTLTAALRTLDEAGIGLDDVGRRRPTLDDVFLTLTGRSVEDGDPEPATTHGGA
jgi:ABC-2 type transport system ATP-binding protein